MSAANGGAGGQAPASDPQTGQAPQVNNGGSPSTAPTGQASSGNNAQPAQGQPMTPADYERIISDLRKENAAHRTENAKTAADLKKFQDAQLSDAERKDKQLAELQQQNAALQIEQQQYRLAKEIGKHAPALNLIDQDAAMLMLTAGGELDTDGNGNYTNVAKLLEKLVTEKPYLVASNVRTPPPPPSSGGATNPGRGTSVLPQGQPQRADPKEAYRQHKQGGGLANPALWKR